MIDTAIIEESELRQQKILGEPIEAAALDLVTEKRRSAEADLRAIKVVITELHKKLRETIIVEREEDLAKAQKRLQSVDEKKANIDMTLHLAEFVAQYRRVRGYDAEFVILNANINWCDEWMTRNDFEARVKSIMAALDKKEGPSLYSLRDAAQNLALSSESYIKIRALDLLQHAGVDINLPAEADKGTSERRED